MAAALANTPVDYGIAPRGTFRLLTVDPSICTSNWFINTVFSHDRTWNEWQELIKEWRKPCPFNVYAPFTSLAAAADFLETTLAKERRLHAIARKFINKVRARICARRLVGADEDLYTTLPIPADKVIKVIDYKTKSTYCFHPTTALKSVMSALTYNSYGIASPQPPKNPYTNIPWNLGQLITLTNGIGMQLWTAHKHIPAFLTSFRECHYNLVRFMEVNHTALQIEAAVGFFKATYTDDVRGVYEDSLIELYDEAFGDRQAQYRTVRRLAVQRLLAADLMERWDRIALDGWVYSNHRMVHYSDSFEDLLDDLRRLHTDSYNSWNSSPRRILRRETAVAAAAADPALSNLVTRSALEAAAAGIGGIPVNVISLNHLLSQSLLDAINAAVSDEMAP